jgi:diphosphomevalonate decarboxylase
MKTTAIAHPNIAFIKYWGNANPGLRLPATGSISMNLEGLETMTTIAENRASDSHRLVINGEEQNASAWHRLNHFLEIAGKMVGFSGFLSVESTNNFPMGTGIASSASAFASLAVALNHYYELKLSQQQISSLARLGSGSACRSIPPGFSEWKKGTAHEDSFAESIAPATHWDLYDCILVVSREEKKIGSTEGHLLADTSPLQSTRVHDTPRRLEICRQAILNKDFEKLASIIELDSDMMHAVMLTSNPPLAYWQPASVAIMREVRSVRARGVACAYSMDAGPNVHVICQASHKEAVQQAFEGFPGVQRVFVAKTGQQARIIGRV